MNNPQAVNKNQKRRWKRKNKEVGSTSNPPQPENPNQEVHEVVMIPETVGVDIESLPEAATAATEVNTETAPTACPHSKAQLETTNEVDSTLVNPDNHQTIVVHQVQALFSSASPQTNIEHHQDAQQNPALNQRDVNSDLAPVPTIVSINPSSIFCPPNESSIVLHNNFALLEEELPIEETQNQVTKLKSLKLLKLDGLSLHDVKKSTDEDYLVWWPNIKRHFFAQGAFQEIRFKRPKVHWSKHVWNSYIHPKHAGTVWKLCSKATATDENIKKRGVTIVSKCRNCGAQEESLIHLLWECVLAKEIWNWLAGKFKFRGTFTNMKEAIKLSNFSLQHLLDLTDQELKGYNSKLSIIINGNDIIIPQPFMQCLRPLESYQTSLVILNTVITRSGAQTSKENSWPNQHSIIQGKKNQLFPSQNLSRTRTITLELLLLLGS
ncbi:hypothetical protein IFM89_011027 [Coptis chinensis]|uniref:Reverse transcriptase zinc-binding domain-containing protein n=1 Tax=Coptis chinensis TaxID=261450 RepID=A0A835IPG8_9MAGN|nr:hypothetical protein IFM89_011027 [Coptis chinensis]